MKAQGFELWNTTKDRMYFVVHYNKKRAFRAIACVDEDTAIRMRAKHNNQIMPPGCHARVVTLSAGGLMMLAP